MSARTRVIRFNHDEIERLREALVMAMARTEKGSELYQQWFDLHERLEHWYNPARVEKGKVQA